MFVPHGDVGDWRLSDEEFLKTFHLPSSRCDVLKERHPFPREDRIVFDEGPHTYTIDGQFVMPRSVTGLIHKYTSEFNAQLVIAEMQARDSWARKQNDYLRPDGEVMKAEEIAEGWQHNGMGQRNRGTLFHYHCETFLNFATIEGPPRRNFISGCSSTITLLQRSGRSSGQSYRSFILACRWRDRSTAFAGAKTDR